MKYKSVIVIKRGGPDVLKVIEDDLRPPSTGEARIKIHEKSMIKNVKAPVGDFHDWDTLTAWAASIADELKEAKLT